MTTILPAERTPFDVLGRDIGQALQGVLPGAVQQGYQRQLGLNALDQAQNDIGNANGDPFKIAMAFARAGAQNEALSRSLGPLYQTAIQQSRVGKAFGQGPSTPPMGGTTQQTQPGQVQQAPSTSASPGPFNVLTPAEIDAASRGYAEATLDPNAYQQRQTQLQNQNTIATQQREALEDFALKSGVDASDLPRFMIVGSKFDPRNPSEWAQNTKREFAKVKSNDEKLQRAFIPGLGTGLLGRNRSQDLKKLEKPVQDLVKSGLEQETRNYLTDQYLTPTEVEELINPLTPEKQKALASLPNGSFPFSKPLETTLFNRGEQGPRVSYDQALEKFPERMGKQQGQLADFFLRNVDPNTSLLVLRDSLWKNKGYDWRQIGPAIREAESRGLKLSDRQSTELTDVETQPPYESLSDIFKDFDRVVKYLRGNK